MEEIRFSFYDKLIITPRPGDKYKILEDFTYKDVTVPTGYHTNGANIPRLLWWIWPPNRSDYLPAVVIHDYLCDKEEYEKADKYFKEILEHLKINRKTILFFHTGTVLYHKIRYDFLNIK
jgi:hypothetical protein